MITMMEVIQAHLERQCKFYLFCCFRLCYFQMFILVLSVYLSGDQIDVLQ